MATQIQVTIDCADPGRLAAFWALALGYRPEPPPTGFATWTEYWRARGVPEEELGEGSGNDYLVDPDGVGPRIWLQQVPEPKTVKNRLHLDLRVSGGRTTPYVERRRVVTAEAERLVAAGATRVRNLEHDESESFAIVMRDPEGNEFCVC